MLRSVASQSPGAVAVTGGTIDGTTIGGTTPAAGSFTAAKVGAGAVGTPSIAFTADADNGMYYIGSNNYGFAAAGAKVLDIGTAGLGVTGNVTPSGLVDISGAAAGQIKFPAAQNASADANTLDDYEEGTWTATLKGSVTDPTTAVTATGVYTKIGNIVYFNVRFQNVNTTGAAGNVSITGLPFTARSATTQPVPLSTYSMLTYSGDALLGHINGTTVNIYSMASNSPWSEATHNAGTGRYLAINGVYVT